MDSARWIIQYLCCLSFCLSTISCFISVQGHGEQCSSETVAELWQHEPNWILLNDSEYCFVNECTIRVKESNVSLTIVTSNTVPRILKIDVTKYSFSQY